MVPLPCILGRYHLFRNDVQRSAGQPDIDFRTSTLLWTAIEVNKVPSVPDVCSFSVVGREGLQCDLNKIEDVLACSGLPKECKAVLRLRGILQAVHLQFCRHGRTAGLLDRKGRPIHLATGLRDGIYWIA